MNGLFEKKLIVLKRNCFKVLSSEVDLAESALN